MTTRNLTSTSTFGQRGLHVRTHEQSGENTAPALRAEGILTENPYSAKYGDLFDYDASWSYTKTGAATGFGKCSDLGGALVVADPPALTDLDVLNKLLEKWRGGDWNPSVTAGESVEAWTLIADRVRRLARGYKAVRRGDVGSAVRFLAGSGRAARHKPKRLTSREVSATWLEMQYGWIPLVKDIYAASEFTSVHVSMPTLRTSKRSWGPAPTPSGGSIPANRVNDGWVNERLTSVKLLLTSTEVPLPERLGLTDPVTVLWELLPGSFILDWVLPIGDFLTALHAIRAIPAGKYIRTDVRKYTGSLDLYDGERFAGVWLRQNTRYSLDHFEMDRTVSETLPSSLSLAEEACRSTKSILDFSLTRTANAVALLHQAVTGRRRV